MTKKKFIIDSLHTNGLTSDQLINKWIDENKIEFDERIAKYYKSGKEKNGENKFTNNQIRAELISIINKNSELFTSEVVITNVDTENSNFRIIAEKIYLLK